MSVCVCASELNQENEPSPEETKLGRLKNEDRRNGIT